LPGKGRQHAEYKKKRLDKILKSGKGAGYCGGGLDVPNDDGDRKKKYGKEGVIDWVNLGCV